MKTFRLFIAIAITIDISSCKTKHDLTYFEDIENSTSGILQTNETTHRLEPENEITINVNSSVPEATAMFNLPLVNPATPSATATTGAPHIQTYIIDNKGDIDFPVLGRIHVAGMTTYELRDYLYKRISEYVKDPIITVNFLNYKVTIIGEVGAPKTIRITGDRYSILNALGDCGDLTDYAKRDNILVMRRMPDGNIEYGRIDLHSSDITKSPYFWLKNNDVIIVEPNGIKQDNSKYNSNNAYKLSVISTIVGISASVISLIIALAIRK